MNANPSKPTLSRKLLWPGIAILALLVWTAFCHVQWLNRSGAIHGLLAFSLGVLVLLVVNALVRFCVGAWRSGWRWLGSREALCLCGWTVVFIVSTGALFYAVELWRGKRAWAAVTREAQTRGESLDYKTLRAPQPPDERNFARAPLFAPFFESPPQTSFSQFRTELSPQLLEIERFAVRFHQHHTLFGPWFAGNETDLAELWRFHFPKQSRTREVSSADADSPGENISAPTPAHTSGVTNEMEAAAALLAELEKFRSVLDELRPFSERPESWFPLDERLRGTLFKPPHRTIDGLLRLLRMRASAELALDRTEAALDDVHFILRLANLGRRKPQPTSVAYALHHSAVVDALQPLWEGLGRRCWMAAQIAEVQRQLEALDLLSDYPDSVRADALSMAAFVESLIPTSRRMPARQLFDTADEQRTLDFLRLIYPVGWSLQNQAAVHQFHFQTTSRYLDVNTRRVVGRRHGTEPGGLFTSSDPLFPLLMTPRALQMYDDASESFPLAQTAVDLATVACALERHRLANSEFPPTLDALAPRFAAKLPNDIITGEPLKYRRTDDGGFVLYSVGFNQVDDGGRPCVRCKNWRGELEPRFDLDQNDWAWIHRGDKVSR
jgi:hypothetical protein